MMEVLKINVRLMQQKYFENADKLGKLLAWQIKEKRKKAIK